MTKRLIFLISMGFLTLLTTGCMIPLQQGGFNANVRGPNYSVGIGGAGSTGGPQGSPVQQHGNPCPQGGIWDGRGCVISCPPGSRWDGRGCLVFQQPVVRSLNSSGCPSGFRMINGRWICMDQTGFIPEEGLSPTFGEPQTVDPSTFELPSQDVYVDPIYVTSVATAEEPL